MTLLVGQNAAGWTLTQSAFGGSGDRPVCRYDGYVAVASGTATAVYLWIGNNNPTYAKVYVYDSSNNLLATSAQMTAPGTSGWVSAAISLSITSGQTYKFVVACSGDGSTTGGGYPWLGTDNGGGYGGSEQFLTADFPYSSPPASIATAHANSPGAAYEFAVYLDGTTGGGSVALAGAATAGASATGTLTTKKAKLRLALAAAGATVDGIVWANQVGAIAGAEIGEFTGQVIATGSGADAGYAVLKVPVTAFGGGALNVGDTVQMFVRNATNFSDLWPATIIEE